MINDSFLILQSVWVPALRTNASVIHFDLIVTFHCKENIHV